MKDSSNRNLEQSLQSKTNSNQSMCEKEVIKALKECKKESNLKMGIAKLNGISTIKSNCCVIYDRLNCMKEADIPCLTRGSINIKKVIEIIEEKYAVEIFKCKMEYYVFQKECESWPKGKQKGKEETSENSEKTGIHSKDVMDKGKVIKKHSPQVKDAVDEPMERVDQRSDDFPKSQLEEPGIMSSNTTVDSLLQGCNGWQIMIIFFSSLVFLILICALCGVIFPPTNRVVGIRETIKVQR